MGSVGEQLHELPSCAYNRSDNQVIFLRPIFWAIFPILLLMLSVWIGSLELGLRLVDPAKCTLEASLCAKLDAASTR